MIFQPWKPSHQVLLNQFDLIDFYLYFLFIYKFAIFFLLFEKKRRNRERERELLPRTLHTYVPIDGGNHKNVECYRNFLCLVGVE